MSGAIDGHVVGSGEEPAFIQIAAGGRSVAKASGRCGDLHQLQRLNVEGYPGSANWQQEKPREVATQRHDA